MHKIILTTGGTGGHIFPALAVAEALAERDVELLFIGGEYGQEAELAAKAGIPFKSLPSRGFMGRGLKAIPAAWDLGMSLLKALRLINKFNPCAVAAFGGYASFAPALAAILLRRPLLIHEQNAIAGASNHILSKMATTLCASLPDTKGFKKPYIVTGNPVRQNLRKIRDESGAAGKRLLVLGGSQGAHALNEFIINNLPSLRQAGIEIRHQCGQKDFAQTVESYRQAGLDPACVSAFIDDMASAYSWADLALCRAGASTVAELCIAGLPAVLVPFPAAIHDHQTKNAQIMAAADAAILLPQTELDKAGELIISLLSDSQKLAQMSRIAESLAKPGAAGHVAAEILKLCGQNKNNE